MNVAPTYSDAIPTRHKYDCGTSLGIASGDTILRWCAKASEYPPVPGGRGLDEAALTDVPAWLRGVYPELFEREHLRERLLFYDVQRELALYAHHPDPDTREAARDRIARVLAGHNHLDGLAW